MPEVDTGCLSWAHSILHFEANFQSGAHWYSCSRQPACSGTPVPLHEPWYYRQVTTLSSIYMGPGDLGSGLWSLNWVAITLTTEPRPPKAVALFLRNRVLLYDLKYKLSGLNIPGAGITGAPTHPLKTVFGAQMVGKFSKEEWPVACV